MMASGVVYSVLFLIPVIIIAINLFGISSKVSVGYNSESGAAEEAPKSVAQRFLHLGVYALIFVGALTSFIAWPGISGVLRFTGVTDAKVELLLFGAVSLPLFGVLYKAIPLLLGRESWCPKLAEGHYWLAAVGFWLLAGVLALSGLFTGLALSDPTVTFLNITSYGFPFHVLEVVAQLLLFVAALMLGFNVTRAFAGEYLFPKRS
jgi:cytochrome c oxidase cbb3-type subunit 1